MSFLPVQQLNRINHLRRNHCYLGPPPRRSIPTPRFDFCTNFFRSLRSPFSFLRWPSRCYLSRVLSLWVINLYFTYFGSRQRILPSPFWTGTRPRPSNPHEFVLNTLLFWWALWGKAWPWSPASRWILAILAAPTSHLHQQSRDCPNQWTTPSPSSLSLHNTKFTWCDEGAIEFAIVGGSI